MVGAGSERCMTTSVAASEGSRAHGGKSALSLAITTTHKDSKMVNAGRQCHLGTTALQESALGLVLGLGPRQSSIVMNLHYLISIRIVLILSVIAYMIEPCTMHIVLSFLLQLQTNCLAFSIACVILEAIYTPDEVWGRD